MAPAAAPRYSPGMATPRPTQAEPSPTPRPDPVAQDPWANGFVPILIPAAEVKRIHDLAVSRGTSAAVMIAAAIAEIR